MLHLVGVCLCCYTVPDPDLELRGAGRGGARSSRPLDKGEMGPVSKKFFRPFGPQFGLKIRGGPGPPGTVPWIRHCYIMM